MKTAEIKKLVAKKDQLTNKEKEKLAQGILSNKKARETAIIGAIGMENWNLVAQIYCT